MRYFVDDGPTCRKCGQPTALHPTCYWCGKPGVNGENIEIWESTSSRALWMHVDCKQINMFRYRRPDKDFWANAMKFARGEPSDIRPGTEAEYVANIAKDLIKWDRSLALPEKLQELISAVSNNEQAEGLGLR